jgi:DNA recombination protein RmuC
MVGWLFSLILGGAFGALLAWLGVRGRGAAIVERARHLETSLATTAAERDRLRSLEPEVARLGERAALLDELEATLGTTFKLLAADELERRSSTLVESTKQLVEPLRESLERVGRQANELEQARRQAYGAVKEQLRSLSESQEQLRTQTGNLVTALRKPHVRGRWGEVQLKRVVELAGMLPHCDFVEQETTSDEDGRLLRPDIVVRIPGGKHVVIDAKTPLDAYLDWLEADDDATRAARLAVHARQVREHVVRLSAKRYWQQFAPAPDFVVMFLPDESFLRAAQEHDPSIAEAAWRANVILASPTNLITLLRTIAVIWTQEAAAEDARAISALGRELYDRLGTVGKHVAKLGRSLDGAVGAYNEAVGSLESRVFVTARKLEQQGVPGELPPLEPIERQSRPLQALELTVDTEAVLELPSPTEHAA